MKLKTLMTSGLMALLPTLALAQDATETVDKGDVAWMMTATLLVLFMILPGLALFYGGLVRSKNMLSVLMQCTLITAMVMVIWVVYGYSFAFGGGTSPYWGGMDKLFLAGVTPDSLAATFTDGVMIPEYLSLVVWFILKATVGIRVTEEAEINGLDMHELGMEAYPEFAKG